MKNGEFINHNYNSSNMVNNNRYYQNDKEDSLRIENQQLHYNWFIWKILNQNFLRTTERINIEIYFQLGKEFEKVEVNFNYNFTKTIENSKSNDTLKYHWETDLLPQEIIVLDVKFPLYFDFCGRLNVSWIMVIIGAIFIIFLISMLHMILSTVFFDEF